MSAAVSNAAVAGPEADVASPRERKPRKGADFADIMQRMWFQPDESAVPIPVKSVAAPAAPGGRSRASGSARPGVAGEPACREERAFPVNRAPLPHKAAGGGHGEIAQKAAGGVGAGEIVRKATGGVGHGELARKTTGGVGHGEIAHKAAGGVDCGENGWKPLGDALVAPEAATGAEPAAVPAPPGPPVARRGSQAQRSSGAQGSEPAPEAIAPAGHSVKSATDAGGAREHSRKREDGHREEPVPSDPANASRLRTGDMAAPTKPTTAGGPVAEAAAPRLERLQDVVERFGEHLAKLTRDNGGTMTIELTPRSLGRITLNCRVTGKEMFLELMTETGATRVFLADHAQALRDVVQNSGYVLSQFDVKTRDEQADPRRPGRPFDRARARGGRGSRSQAVAGTVERAAPSVGSGGRDNGVWLVA